MYIRRFVLDEENRSARKSLAQQAGHTEKTNDGKSYAKKIHMEAVLNRNAWQAMLQLTTYRDQVAGNESLNWRQEHCDLFAISQQGELLSKIVSGVPDEERKAAIHDLVLRALDASQKEVRVLDLASVRACR